MMKFVHTDIETPIELSEEYTFVLILENASDFYFKVTDFKAVFDGAENGLSFWTENKLAKPDKYGDLLTDLFSFEMNNKRMLNLLYKKAEESYQSGAGIVKLNEITTDIMSFFKDTFFDFPFLLDYDEVSFSDLLKACSVRFTDSYDTLLERILCYINILVELKNLKFMVFVNLKSVLRDEELICLYRHCRNEKIALLLLESGKIRPLLPEEKAVIITQDLCEILENEK